MDLIGKIFGIGIVVCVSDMLLVQAGRKDIAFAVTIVGVVLVMTISSVQMFNLFKSVTTMFNIGM